MKVNIILFIIGFTCLVTCKVSSQLKTLEIGDSVSSDDLRDSELKYVLSSKLGLVPEYKIVIDKITYKIGVDDERIVYISTKDKRFKTKENISLGMTLKAVEKLLQKKAELRIGYAWYIPLASGWNAAFIIPDYNSREPISPTSKVAFFFKE